MNLRPITQAEWEAWCAQPGTDAMGYPWSSWHHVIATEAPTPAPVAVAASAQLELAL